MPYVNEVVPRKKVYEESPGNTSTTRVALITGLAMGFVLAIMVIVTKWEAGIFLPLAAWGIPMTGKTVEKFKK